MEEELQKTERSYKNQVNFLLAGYCVTFYCIIPMLCRELLEILVVGQNKQDVSVLLRLLLMRKRHMTIG